MKEFISDVLHEFSLPFTNPVLAFSLILLIIFLSPILLKRLKIPGIIGLIISGIIIGPFGFNIIEKNAAVELFSTIGLLYIMFIAGLDLNISQFKANKNKSLSFGFFTFAIPLGIGFVLCYYVLGYCFNASLLTASMFATHTLVAYPIVSRMGITKNEVVAIAVGGTILTDTAVLMVLAIIIGNAEGALNLSFFVRLGISFGAFLFIMFYIIPKLSRWVFRKLESEKYAQYIYVLSIMFFAAFLAELAGLEPIIGAFVAGLALNQLISRTSALMHRIEFSGNALFIPFFLISVGMIVDVRIVFNGWTAIIVAVVLTVGALLGKWLAAYATQIIFKYSSAQRQLIFGLSASHAAATLAVILVGYKLGILDENILNGTIILILITCIVASFATEKAARKILLSSTQNETHEKNSFKGQSEHILLPIANIDGMSKLLDFALMIKNKKSANPITILSVVPNNELAELNLISTREKLQEYISHVAETEIPVNVIATIDHNSVEGIGRVALETHSDILILGWPGRAGIINKIAVEKVNSIISRVDKNVFICSIDKILQPKTNIVLITSPFAEKETGFLLWANKILRVATELNSKIIHYGEKEVDQALTEVLKTKKYSTKIDFIEFDNWDNVEILKEKIHKDDLLVMVSARKNSISYIKTFGKIISKTEKNFSEYKKIVIFPKQYDSHGYKHEDLSDNPIAKGFEAIENLGKEIGKRLNKDN